ncbi:MAG TPA: hypothetical protein VD866_19350 [Urbifossiella sp.]|nr:hypothetical protein [Urbifossiella sp.]
MRRPTATGTFLFVALLTLAGCGKNPRPAPEPEPEPTPAVPVVTPPPKEPTPPPDPPPTPAPSPIPPVVAGGPMPMPPPMPMPVIPMPPDKGMAVVAQPPVPPPVLPPPPETKKKDEGGSTSVKVEWPKSINGRTLLETIKDTRDIDPAVRERSLRIIPNFGPDIVRGEPTWAKAALERMARDKELDPGVRAAAYEAVGAVGMEKKADVDEAVRILFTVAERGESGGGARLHAIQTLSVFGSKAYGAITALLGPPMQDAAYETRRSVAFTLGRIALHDHAGPNHKAQEALFKLAGDHSAPVRMEAYQSLVILGPPLAPRDPRAPLLKDLKNEVPRTDEKVAAGYVASIKRRLAPAPPPKTGETASPTGLVERDKQVEIMARLVLMRYDPKEITDENLSGIARYANDKEVGPRLQALNVLAQMGPAAAVKIDDVVRALTAEEADVVVSALTTLVQFGPASKAAIPAVERLRTRGTTDDEKKYWQKLTDDAVKAIRDTDKKDKKP